LARSLTIPALDAALSPAALVLEESWSGVAPVTLDEFPWYRAGTKQRTAARLASTATHLCAEFLCEDGHISSQAVALNGDVWKDSCVELFFCPDPVADEAYFNLEINACGVLLLAFGRDRHARRFVDWELAAEIVVAHSVPGPTKEDAPGDNGWRIATAVPFRILEALSGMSLRHSPGTRWTGNLYRCGGRTDPHYAAWSPIPLPSPDYHCPQYFGEWAFL
jgi:hypothetical protein